MLRKANQLDFSVIIVNYNSTKFLITAIESFIVSHQKSNQTYEFIIIDNGSKKSEYQLLSLFIARQKLKNELSINLYQSFGNQGFGAANNQAVSHARGEHLLFLNPDTDCQFPLLETMGQALQDRSIAFVSPQLILANGTSQVNAYGSFPNLFSTVLNKFYRLPKNETNSTLLSVDWLSGACFAARTNIFKLLGGFDSQYFMYYEDVDLCRQAYCHKLKNQLIPSLTLVHYGGQRPQLTRSRRALYFKAQAQYFKKWHSFSYLPLLIIRFPYLLLCYFKDLP